MMLSSLPIVNMQIRKARPPQEDAHATLTKADTAEVFSLKTLFAT
jgi:hypothetical protein